MDPTYTDEYEDYVLRHWWHVARREIIEGSLDRALERLREREPRWFDVGCGTGVLLDHYHRIPRERKMGAELDEASVERARRKGLDVRRAAEGAWDFRPYGRFDLVTMCDVIEHVEDDRRAIAAVREVLNDGGIVLVTVPALRSLWSSHDVINHHFRRYHRADLARLFPAAQWQVLRLSYFSSFLLPLIWSVRQLKNARERRGAKVTPDKKFGPRWLDATLLATFRAEKRWLRHVDMPVGSSLILVAQKKEVPRS